MSRPKIGFIIGSTREERFADHPREWIEKLADKRSDFELVTLDLRDYDMPFFGTGAGKDGRKSDHPPVKAWLEQIDALDGYIVTAAEYNHGPTAVLKNALDYGYDQWNRKPIGFVGYGGVGGARSVQQLRQIAVELQMTPVRSAVHILMPVYLAIVKEGKSLDDFDYLGDNANGLFDDMVWWARALTPAREEMKSAA